MGNEGREREHGTEEEKTKGGKSTERKTNGERKNRTEEEETKRGRKRERKKDRADEIRQNIGRLFCSSYTAFSSSEVLWLQSGGCRFSKCAGGSCFGHVRLGNVAVARVSGTLKIIHAYKK